MIEFNLISDQKYFDLSTLELVCKAKIIQGPTTKNTAGADVAAPVAGPINNFLHSLIKECAVYLSGVQVTPPNDDYPYRALIETYLNHSQEWMKSQGQSCLFFADSESAMDDVAGVTNVGLRDRTEIAKDGKEFEMRGQLHTGMIYLAWTESNDDNRFF